MNAHVSNPKALAKTLFYAVTNTMQYGHSAKLKDAINMAMNIGIDITTQNQIGLIKELEQLNWN